MSAMVPYPLPDNEKEITEEVLAAHTDLTSHWAPLRARQTDIRSLVENKWGNVFGNDVSSTRLPQIANFFRDQVEDVGRLFGAVMPTTRVYAEDDTDDDAAELRERIAVAYDERSHLRHGLSLHGQDFPAAGYTAIKCWPERGKRGAERFPVFSRIDPLSVLPEKHWRPGHPTEYALVCEDVALSLLAKAFPEQAAYLSRQMAEQTYSARAYGYSLSAMARAQDAIRQPKVQVVDCYTTAYIAKIAVVQTNTGKNDARLLWYQDNDTGLCPVQISYRPTWGSEPQGLLDDAKGPVQTRNRYWNILLDYFVQMVYGGKLVWNVKNPADRGPNQTYYALGPDASMKPVGPDPASAAAFQMLAQLEAEARETAVKPTSREGEMPANKLTAAGLTRAQGKLSDLVRELHTQFAQTKMILNAVAFEQDRRWCNAEGKKITGIARGRRFTTTYTPSEAITDTQTWVSYGASSGLDLPTHTVLNQNKVTLGLMDRETFWEEDPGTEEPQQMANRFRKQVLLDAFMAQVAESGGLAAAGEAFLAFNEGAKDDEWVRRTLAAQQQQQSPIPQVVGGAPGAPGAPNPAAALGPPGAESPAVPLPPQELLRAGGR